MGVKEGYLTWEEFLDFFFLKEQRLGERAESGDWWINLNTSGHKIEKKVVEEETFDNLEAQDNSKQDVNTSNVSNLGALIDRKEPEMTRSLRHLQDVRQSRTAQDVEEEFTNMQGGQKTKTKTK